MDYFKSVIIVRSMVLDTTTDPAGQLDMEFDLINNDPSVENFENDDDLHIETGEWGWWNGGLHKLLKLQYDRAEAPREALFFRGEALFGNFDDAKNDYLMDPEMECFDNKGQIIEDSAHVPFGMVIPNWEKSRVVNSILDQPRLISVTVTLFWQEL